ncbi:MAG TPA: DUF6569 family protein [Kofleriaceae bacterium]|nr:DUF6569 family protein [Kofleriaceae bacterium]
MRTLGVLAVVTLIGCGSEPSAPTPAPAPPRPSRRAELAPKPDRPVQKPIDLALGTGFEMRPPIRDGRLTLVPIVATGDVPATRFITLQEGMHQGVVTVRETGHDDWQVQTLKVSNRSKLPLFVMSGELVLDAKQDRVLAEDVVIPAGETAFVAARCVEKERGEGGTRFRAGNALAELELRRTIVYGTQDDVWRHVDRISAREDTESWSHTYRLAAQRQSEPSARRTTLLDALAAIDGRDRMVGLAVAVDNQVLAIDRFATPALYRQLERMLVASYLPGVDGDLPAESRKLGPDDVRSLARSTLGTSTPASYVVLRK